ncbi:MAG: alcohol dehydrogenase catalytic domain-containing protein [Methanotrichaceae archaeon]|nr:alcohol dehydrogenase catalytic domain-containing protein [Methanotrichaceae archaeon]
MRAAVLRGPGLLEIEDIAPPTPPPGGILLEVLACSICGTDARMVARGHSDLTYPRIPGHEVTGRIVEGEGGGVDVGDLVQVWPGIACGRCGPCLRGRDNQCREMEILGFSRDGGLSELLALPPEGLDRGLNRLPPGADPVIFTLAEPLACCINAQWMAGVSPGDCVLILGGGPLGVLHSILARRLGADLVLLAERDGRRIRQLAGRSNFRLIDSSVESLAGSVEEETDGEGVDVMIIAAPGIELDRSHLDMLSPGGRLCVFSGPGEVSLPLGPVHYRDLTVIGSHGCSSQQNRMAVEMIAKGGIDLEWLITFRSSIEGVCQAFLHARERHGLRAVIVGG